MKNVEKVQSAQFSKMTILILSESGAGKSAWINGTIKYSSLKNEDFSDLDSNSRFTVIDNKINLSPHFILNTENGSRKDQEKGQPSKDDCKSWSFSYKCYAISLIDTPTFFGKGGVEQYQNILEKILSMLPSIKQINGICIFLKSQNSQLIIKLNDIITKMYKSLQNDFIKNITFCFTNTRSNLYRPGNTIKGLRDVLKTLPTNIPLNTNGMFCFDNEGFKFLAAASNRDNQVQIPKEYESIYLVSLKKSLAEIDRLFKKVSEMQPILTQSTLNPNKCSYIKDMSGNIESNSEKPQHFAMSKFGMSASYSRLGNRAFLSISCPGKNCAQTPKAAGFLKIATDAKQPWFCPNCNEKIQYGFDCKFYCQCGCASVDTYKFKCPYSDHNKYEELHNLNELLTKQIPFKKINILILHESGVGKSAWINGFVNYLTFPSIEKAELGSLCNVKPFSFNLTDEEANDITVNIQTETNKYQRTGQSSCHDYKSHSFSYDGYLINLIDAPTFFEEKGITKKKYITRIQKIIQTLRVVNGICFLMKPKNSSLINEVYNIVTELQKILSQDLCKNVMFGFTNSRTSFYRPEYYVEILKDKLKYPSNNIPIEKSTVYGFENEAYKLLAAIKNEKHTVRFSYDVKTSFTLSWQISVTETRRMVKHVCALNPCNFLFLNYRVRMALNVIRANINEMFDRNKNLKSEETTENQDSLKLGPSSSKLTEHGAVEIIPEEKGPKEVTILLISGSGEVKISLD